VSAFRRSLPLLAVGLALAAVVVTAALTPRAAGTPSSDAVAAAAVRSETDAGLLAVQHAAERASLLQMAAASLAAQTAKAQAAAKEAAYQSSAPEQTAALRARGIPCDSYAVACVSLSRQEAWLMRGGRVIYGPVRVATGRASLPTPAGNFHVWYKVVDGWSTTYDAPMPYSVFFYEGDAFHEDPVTVRSHGCIHLSLKNAEYFYRFLDYGDLVEVRY
jgi:lipoprotein-anchoring transpeptidase ErfK/SrfK